MAGGGYGNRGQWTEPASTTARPDELADPIAEDIAEWISDAHVGRGDQLIPWRSIPISATSPAQYGR